MNNFLKLIISGFIVVLLLIGLHYLTWLRPIEGAVVRMLSPISTKTHSFSVNAKEFYGDWILKRDLLKENEVLRQKLEEARISKSRLNSLVEENDLLKEELRFAREHEITMVAATIITGVSDSFSKSVVINRGSNENIEKGMAVVAGEGIMIGKIYEVYPDYSKVLLLTDNKSSVAATIQNLDRTTGLVEGQFGLSFSMTNIPQDQEIQEGDLIVTSGLEGKIPKNLLIAEVDSVVSIESEIFKTAHLSPIIPFGNLSHVLVVVP